MAQLMSNIDVLVVPFRSTKGISDVPIVVLEAMALGKPIVASSLEGIKEAIKDGENGVIVNSSIPQEFARSIISILDDPELRENLRRNAVMSVKKFSFSQISLQLIDLYTKLLED